MRQDSFIPKNYSKCFKITLKLMGLKNCLNTNLKFSVIFLMKILKTNALFKNYV